MSGQDRAIPAVVAIVVVFSLQSRRWFEVGALEANRSCRRNPGPDNAWFGRRYSAVQVPHGSHKLDDARFYVSLLQTRRTCASAACQSSADIKAFPTLGPHYHPSPVDFWR